MAEHSSPPRKSVGHKFKKKMTLYSNKRTLQHPIYQKAINNYISQPERSQTKIEYDKLGYLERILHDDARRANETRLPRWELKKNLGEGSYGVVTMWERYRGPNQEPLRLACKLTSFENWFEDMCEEANITQKLNEIGCVNVVKIIDWEVESDRGKFRILYEYCPHGTLGHFMKYHYTHCNVTIPEAMIWHVFNSLATTICYHAHGTTAEEGIAGWEKIIHRDIKPYNVLMAEPDPNNRPLYPTIKLADYGLAYRQNDDIHNLKANLWSAGTDPYAAPEVMSSVRQDKAQTPHPMVYPETDIFSVGCIILEMMRMPFTRYPSDSAAIIDYEFPFPYKSFPYSNILRDLAMDCVRIDVRTRPLARDVYKRTKFWADLWYGQISGPSVEKPQEAYAGQVLWSKDLRNHFETNTQFRWSYTIHNDWFHNHQDSVAQLHRTNTDPGKANVPRGDVVAIGNGLALEKEITGPPGQKLDTGSIGVWPMRVFNSGGKLLKRRDGKAIRRLTRAQLHPPKLDEGWKVRRVKLLEDKLMELSSEQRVTDAQMEKIMRYARQLLNLRFDSPTKNTSHRLQDLIRVRDILQISKLGQDAQGVLRRFANQMIDYLSCQTATNPRYIPYEQHETKPLSGQTINSGLATRKEPSAITHHPRVTNRATI